MLEKVDESRLPEKRLVTPTQGGKLRLRRRDGEERREKEGGARREEKKAEFEETAEKERDMEIGNAWKREDATGREGGRYNGALFLVFGILCARATNADRSRNPKRGADTLNRKE